MRAFLLLLAVTSLASQSATPTEPKGNAAIHILVANDDGEAVGETVTKPLFAFRVEEGKVTQAEIMKCQQQTEHRQQGEFSYRTVVLKCGDVKLVLSGVDLTTHQ